jgi:hypothetical protein
MVGVIRIKNVKKGGINEESASFGSPLGTPVGLVRGKSHGIALLAGVQDVSANIAYQAIKNAPILLHEAFLPRVKD